MSREQSEIRFRLDDQGAEVEGAKQPIDVELDPLDAGLGEEGDLAEQLGARLSKVLGRKVSDEEGIFDLVAEQGGRVVAALQLSSADDDDALVLLGERSAKVSEQAICEALLEALAQPPSSSG